VVVVVVVVVAVTNRVPIPVTIVEEGLDDERAWDRVSDVLIVRAPGWGVAPHLDL
jgi:hypothetical protein